MQSIYNQANELVAYQYQNLILHPENYSVLGLVLGNCVFNKDAKVLGKLFHQKVHDLSGQVLAIRDDNTLPLPNGFEPDECIIQGWQILINIKDHTCPWVTEKETWSETSFAQLLYN
jgi:hypothetical protein